jgi:hypothetical protein
MNGEGFEGWTIMELMGHRRLAGYVREQEIAGHGFLRLDVFCGTEAEPMATQLYSPASVYAMTPTTEALARKIADSSRPAPVARWELPAATETTEGGALGDWEEVEPG